MRRLRTITAKVTSVNDHIITFKVTSVDDRLNPTVLAVGDEPLISYRLPYAPVEDTGERHPIFNFYSVKEDGKELEVESEVVILCEDKNNAITYLYWTTKNEYEHCQRMIKNRIDKRKVQPKQAPQRVVVDLQHYRLSYDNQKFTGTVKLIQTNLYHYNRESQVEGWPVGCTWEIHTGRCFNTCDAPLHPGPNKMLEPKAKLVAA